MQKVSTLKVVKTLDEILSIGASVNIYMFFGGTNFGFKSGKLSIFFLLGLRTRSRP